MKRTSTIFSLMIGLTLISVAMSASGQGRSQRRGGDERDRRQSDTRDTQHQDRYADRGTDRNNNHDHYDRDNRRYNHDTRGDYHDRRVVRHVHHYHDRFCYHQPVVVHHYPRQRYIYYRDYDVYYDRQNSVYISFSGRSWNVSSALPFAMRQVNVRTTRRYEVDYYDDDFPRYLETHRPSYGRECED